MNAQNELIHRARPKNMAHHWLKFEEWRVIEATVDKTIKLHSGDKVFVHRSRDIRVVILEYEVHGKILSSGAAYESGVNNLSSLS